MRSSKKKKIQMKWEIGKFPKKYKVKIYRDGKLYKSVQFGDQRYEHFKDKTPLKKFSHLDHGDLKRRKNYKARHEKNRHVKYSAGWFADQYLW